MLLEKNKLKHIEGIRGLAAIIVVLHHFSLAFYPALNFGEKHLTHIGNGKIELFIAKTPLNIFYNGGFAVCIFFILSGYVLSNSYHQTLNTKVLKQYAIKRYFRLLIPVSVTIFIAYIFIKTGLLQNTGLDEITKTGDWLSGSFNQDGGLADVLKNIFIDVFFFNDNKYNPVLWTMTYELLGSFLIFFFLFIIHRLKYKKQLYITLILLLFMTQNNFSAAFILGVLLNKIVVQDDKAFTITFNNKYLLGGLMLLGLFFCSYPLHRNINSTFYRFITFSFLNNYEFYHVIGSFMVMFVILQSQILKRILSNKIFSFIGKISFSFYLLHFIILCSFTCYLFKHFYLSFHYNTSAILSIIFSIPVIAVTSVFYYKWIDKSGIMLSDLILKLFKTKSELE